MTEENGTEPVRANVSFRPDGPVAPDFRLPASLSLADKLKVYAATRQTFVVVATGPNVYDMMLESEAPKIVDPRPSRAALERG